MDNALVKNICDECGQTIDMAVGQNIVDGYRLVWWGSYSCPHCGSKLEIDGNGIPDTEIREAILRVEGEWGLLVHESSQSATSVVAVLRKALDLPLSEVVKIKKLMPGVVLKGTKTEMKRLQMLLNGERLNASIEMV